MSQSKKPVELTVAQRLLAYIERQGLTRNKFYEISGVANNSIGPDKKDLSSKTIEKTIKVFPDINLYWLISGKGNMNREKSDLTSELDEKLLKMYEKLESSRDENNELKDQVSRLEKDIEIKDITIKALRNKIEDLEAKIQSSAIKNAG